MTRRDIIKGLMTIPVLGSVLYSALRKKKEEHYKTIHLPGEFKNISIPDYHLKEYDKTGTINLGIIGTGLRGNSYYRHLDFRLPH